MDGWFPFKGKTAEDKHCCMECVRSQKHSIFDFRVIQRLTCFDCDRSVLLERKQKHSRWRKHLLFLLDGCLKDNLNHDKGKTFVIMVYF